MRVRNISKIILYHVKIHRKHIGKTIVVHNLNHNALDLEHMLVNRNIQTGRVASKIYTIETPSTCVGEPGLNRPLVKFGVIA